MNRKCKHCGKDFLAPIKEVRRGNGKFCSKLCANRGRKFKSAVLMALTCAYCKKDFVRPKSLVDKGSSKSGLYFCNRGCKDLGQTLEQGIKEIWPDHFGTGNSSYREIAFRHYEKKCSRCGYSKIEDILQVHHRDRNRQNSSIENLEILCPNCHQEEHFVAKDGMWTKEKNMGGGTAGGGRLTCNENFSGVGTPGPPPMRA